MHTAAGGVLAGREGKKNLPVLSTQEHGSALIDGQVDYIHTHTHLAK